MEKSPLISCIIPVFNAERFLAEAIDSVFAQTYRPIEVIVVDDGSTDGSAEVAARYGDRVRYIFQENQGHASARNRGIAEAKGDFLAFLDADDRWHPEKLKRQASVLADDPSVDLCYAKTHNFVDGAAVDGPPNIAGSQPLEPVSVLLPTTALIRRRVFDRHGTFDADLGALPDHHWAIRCSEGGAKIYALDDLLHERRIHRDNLSRTMADRQREEMVRLVKSALDRRRTGESKSISS